MSFLKNLSKMVARANKKADELADTARDMAADAAKRATEIAEEMGISEKGVEYIKKTAMDKARKWLKQKGFKREDFFGKDDE